MTCRDSWSPFCRLAIRSSNWRRFLSPVDASFNWRSDRPLGTKTSQVAETVMKSSNEASRFKSVPTHLHWELIDSAISFDSSALDRRSWWAKRVARRCIRSSANGFTNRQPHIALRPRLDTLPESQRDLDSRTD